MGQPPLSPLGKPFPRVAQTPVRLPPIDRWGVPWLEHWILGGRGTLSVSRPLRQLRAFRGGKLGRRAIGESSDGGNTQRKDCFDNWRYWLSR